MLMVEAIGISIDNDIVKETFDVKVKTIAEASILIRKAWAEKNDVSEEESMKLFNDLHNEILMDIMPRVIEKVPDSIMQMSLYGALACDFAINMTGIREMMMASMEIDEIMEGNL